jgi:hypothetical protein
MIQFALEIAAFLFLAWVAIVGGLLVFSFFAGIVDAIFGR